jgi:hypothetical protein
MSETPVSPLAEIRAAHVLCTHSSVRANIHKAGCACGARYEWHGREEAHAEHVDGVITDHVKAREAAARREALLEAADAMETEKSMPFWSVHVASLRKRAVLAEPERDEEGR